jgi:hypothetical protein
MPSTFLGLTKRFLLWRLNMGYCDFESEPKLQRIFFKFSLLGVWTEGVQKKFLGILIILTDNSFLF